MKYRVLLRAQVAQELTIEAESPEAAATSAYKIANDPRGRREIVAQLRPTAVGTAEHVEAHGEYPDEVLSPCGWCQTHMVQRDVPGQPWVWNFDPKSYNAPVVCFPCLLKGGYVDADGNKIKKETA